MAVPRWAIAVAGLAMIGGTIAWVTTRSTPHGAQPSETKASSASTRPSGPAAISAPANPTLGGRTGAGIRPVPGAGGAADESADSPGAEDDGPAGPPTPSGPPAPQIAFSAQVRDPAWAGATEQTIARRLATVTTLRKTECRATTCELTLGGSSDEVADTLARLETRDGLRDLAANVLLTAPETQDGTMTLRAYVSFER